MLIQVKELLELNLSTRRREWYCIKKRTDGRWLKTITVNINRSMVVVRSFVALISKKVTQFIQLLEAIE